LNLEPLWISLRIAATATLLTVVTGLPIAWLLGRRRFPGHGLLETLVVLPLVLPPTVLGYYLLVLIGRTAWLSALLARSGISLEFTWRIAVLAAWISAFGLFVRAAQPGFESVDRSLEDAARTMGRSEWSVFWAVTLPLAGRAVLAATVLAFCRAIGEFGITVMVAGRLPGGTSLPLSLYDPAQSGGPGAADQLALLTLGLVAVVLLCFGRLTRARR
jgi:molybdate transport system permease protein